VSPTKSKIDRNIPQVVSINKDNNVDTQTGSKPSFPLSLFRQFSEQKAKDNILIERGKLQN